MILLLNNFDVKIYFFKYSILRFCIKEYEKHHYKVNQHFTKEEKKFHYVAKKSV